MGLNSDLSGVDESGATPFWRAAYASDVPAMKLLSSRGADPHLPTIKPAGRPQFGDSNREVKDVSGLAPVPVGGPSVTPLMAATGVGYAEGFAANSHIHSPGGVDAGVKYLVEELGADVNARDHDGNTALHNAAARGDIEMILYLVSKGADVKDAEPRGADDGGYGQRSGAAHSAVSRSRGVARQARSEEQQQVRVVLAAARRGGARPPAGMPAYCSIT